MDQHEMIVALKDVAANLGKVPNFHEFCAHSRVSEKQVRKIFRTYTQLLQAAGLETYESRRIPRIDNTIWNRSIDEHLERYTPTASLEHKEFPTAAIISDIHWPFENARVIDKFIAYIEEHKPEWAIINGDGWDMYSYSKYPRSHNIFTPKEEMLLAKEKNENFWKRVQEAAPGIKCVQMLGNHDVRPLKRILDIYPQAEDWIEEKLQELFTFDGVKTIYDPREELFLRDDIIVFHGSRSGLGTTRDYTLMSCFIGHTHKGGTVFKRVRNGILFECNSGVAGDPESKGLSYTSQKINDMTPGFAAIDKYGPRFIIA